MSKLSCRGQEEGKRILFSITSVIVCLQVFLRFSPGSPMSGQLLWAEDGRVFLQDSQDHGLTSLWIPYAGYLHVFARLIGLLSGLFTLELIPVLFFIAWAVVFCVLIFLVQRIIYLYTSSRFMAVFGGVVAGNFPNIGEVLFNVTNAHWALAFVMAVIVLFFDELELKKSTSARVFFFLLFFILSLSGPFSIFLSMVLLLTFLFSRTRPVLTFVNLPVFLGACIQVGSILISGRSANKELSTDYQAWFDTLFSIVVFGHRDPLLVICSLSVISISGFGFSRAVKKRDLPLISLALFGVFVVLASLIADRNNAAAQAVWGIGSNRYLWMPFIVALIFFFIEVSRFRNPLLVAASLVAITLIVANSSFKLPNSELNFTDFAKSCKKMDVFIPVNPQFAEYPTWGFRCKTVPSEIAPIKGVRDLISVAEHLSPVSVNEFQCQPSGTLLVRVFPKLVTSGWLTLSMVSREKKDSLSLWISKESPQVDFAFGVKDASSLLRYEMPSNSPVHFEYLNVAYFCLK